VQVDARRLPLEAPRVSQRPQTPPQPAPAVSLEAEARSSQSSIEALPEPPAADIPLIVPTEPASSRVPRAGTVMGSGGIPRTPARPFTPARPITPVTFAAEDSEAPAIEQPNAFALGTDDATSPPLDDDIGPAVSTDLPMSPELASVLDEDRIAAQAPVSTRTPPLGVPRAPDPDAQAALIAPPLDVEYTDVDPTRDGAAPQLEVAMPAEQRVRESTSPLLAWSKDEPEPPKRRRRGIVLAFIAVAAVCFAAGGVFVAMQTRGDEPAKSAANPNDQVTTPAPAVAPTTPAAAVVPTSAAPTPATPTVGEPAAPAPQQAAAPTPEPAAAPAESATPEHAAAPTPEPVAATPEPAAAPTPEPVAAPTSEPVVDTAPEKPEPPAVAKPTKPTQAATKPVVKKVVKKPAPARPTKVRRTAPKAACSGLDCL
jgi:hypothetical protein